jgi:hypothetical protein
MSEYIERSMDINIDHSLKKLDCKGKKNIFINGKDLNMFI